MYLLVVAVIHFDKKKKNVYTTKDSILSSINSYFHGLESNRAVSPLYFTLFWSKESTTKSHQLVVVNV